MYKKYTKNVIRKTILEDIHVIRNTDFLKIDPHIYASKGLSTIRRKIDERMRFAIVNVLLTIAKCMRFTRLRLIVNTSLGCV